jgi:hypothetical protein
MTDPESYPVPDPTRTPISEVRRPGVAYLVQELIGAIPPLAALGLAGYYQTEIAHDVLHFAYPWALVPAAAIEGGAAYCAVLYDRHLTAGDSTTALRLGMLGYAAGSSALLGWHAQATGKPWQIAVALGLLTLSALFLWGRRGKWRKREVLRDKGLLDAQVVRFSFARYVAAPLETPAALRYAVKHSIADPRTAVAAWRTHRAERGRTPTVDVTTGTRTAPRVPEPADIATVVPAARRTANRGPVRAIASARSDDDVVLVRLAHAQAEKGTTLTLDEVGRIAGGARPRAVRLRRLLDERADRTPEDDDRAYPSAAGAAV